MSTKVAGGVRKAVEKYKPKNHIRIVSATSLFDGHDASINIMRRIMQDTGAEVIHLGHDRSVDEIVRTAIDEDAHAVAVTSYQGGHIEFFKYLRDELVRRGYGDVRIFGGGGGVILPTEIEELHRYGITRIYHPDDGRAMGLQGMINDVLEKSDFMRGDTLPDRIFDRIKGFDHGAIGKALSVIENNSEKFEEFVREVEARARNSKSVVIGVCGSGGAGKSTFTDEMVRYFLTDNPDIRIGVISIDPTRPRSGGALLGDRLRYNSIYRDNVYFRSVASRGSHQGIPSYVSHMIDLLKCCDCDIIFVETAGIGQGDISITQFAPFTIYVMTPEYGAPTQLEKIGMLEVADIVVVNKYDKWGAEDALKQVRKQYKRNHG